MSKEWKCNNCHIIHCTIDNQNITVYDAEGNLVGSDKNNSSVGSAICRTRTKFQNKVFEMNKKKRK